MYVMQNDKSTLNEAAEKPVPAKASGAADKLRGLAFDEQVEMLAPPGATSPKADAVEKGPPSKLSPKGADVEENSGAALESGGAGTKTDAPGALSPAEAAPDEEEAPAADADGVLTSADDAVLPSPTNAESEALATNDQATQAKLDAQEALQMAVANDETKVQAMQDKLDSVQQQLERLSHRIKKLERDKGKFIALGVLLPPLLLKLKGIDHDLRRDRSKLVKLLPDLPRLTTQIAQQKAELAKKKAALARLGGGGANASEAGSPSAAKVATRYAGPTTGPAAVAAKKVQTTEGKLDDVQEQMKGLSHQIKKLEGDKAKFIVLGMFLPPLLLKLKGIERDIKEKRNKLVKLLPEVPRLAAQLAQERAELARLQRSSPPP